MIIFFTIIFFNTVLGTMNRVEIDAKSTYIQEEDPSYLEINTDNFMFAIGIPNIDLNSGKKWF